MSDDVVEDPPEFPQWDQLPQELKKEVLSKVDNFDRLRSRECCKNINDIVDSIPITTNYLDFTNHSDDEHKSWWWLEWRDSVSSRSKNNMNACKSDENLVVKRFLDFFVKPQSSVCHVDFSTAFLNPTTGGLAVMEELVREARRREITIRVKEFRLWNLNTTPPHLVRQVLELLDENLLEIMYLDEIPGNVLAEIKRTIQWRNCKILYMNRSLETNIEEYKVNNGFMHFKKLIVEKDSLTLKEIRHVFETAKSKPVGSKYQFNLYGRNRIKTNDVLRMLDIVPEIMEDDESEETDPFRKANHKFYTADPKFVLDFYIEYNYVRGYVCERERYGM